MKIAPFEVEDWDRGAFAGLGRDHEVLFQHQALDEETIGGVAEPAAQESTHEPSRPA